MLNRILYLDCLRGIIMLMVVFSHTCGEFCLDCKDEFWVCRIFEILMLPGFFFTSGWFTRISLSGGVILKRFRLMLIPTICMFLMYILIYWGNINKLGYCVLGEYKFGYWFTFALFLINLIHWVVSEILSRLRFDVRRTTIYHLCLLFVVSISILFLKDWDWNYNNKVLAGWFSLRLIAMFFPFYLMGIACRQYERLFHHFICNDYIIGGLMIVFVASLFHINGGFFYGFLQSGIGLLLLYRLCHFYQASFSDNTFVGKQLSMIGRNTLPIYLIHYFFFFGLKFHMIGRFIDSQTQWGLTFVIASALTLLITYGSIAVAKIIGISKPLSKVLIGK